MSKFCVVQSGFIIVLLFCQLHGANAAYSRITTIELTRISGVHGVSETELRDSLFLEHGRNIDASFARDTLLSFVRRIKYFYAVRGYILLHIDSLSLDFSPDSSLAQCSVYLTEGARAVIDSLIIDGTAAMPEKKIRQLMETKSGVALDPGQLNRDIETIIEMYEDNGYPFAAVDVIDIRLDHPAGLALQLYVEEGAHVIIADVLPKSKSETSPDVFRTASGVEIGKQYDQRRINLIAEKLNRLQIFASVGAPELVMRTENMGTLLIPVQESNTTSIDGIIGYVPVSSGQSGYLTGSIDVSFLNLFGSARKFGFHWDRLQINSQDLWAAYHEPWLFGLPISADARVEQLEDDTLYTRRTLQVGASALFADRFTVTGTISLVSTVPGSTDTTVSFHASSENSVGAALTYDSRDNVSNPTSGVYYESGYTAGEKSVSGSASSVPIQNIDVNTEAYYEIVSPMVAALALHGASVVCSALDESDLYKVGGVNSIRGYRDWEFLASRLLWGTAEWRFITGKLSFVSLFSDMGYYLKPSTYDNSLQQSGFLMGYGVSTQVESAIGVLRVSFAVSGGNFSQALIHIGYVNRF